jgi:hypothetical protein
MHILGGSSDTVRALEAVRAQSSALLVCKLGAAGCVVFPNEIPSELNDGLLVPGFPVEVFHVLGAGDAFMAGFLAGWLKGEPLQRCCTLANACGAIVVSRHGCAPAMPTKIELETFLAMDEHPFRLREDVSLEHIHWATTRRGDYDELAVLAIDHRAQLRRLFHACRETGHELLLEILAPAETPADEFSTARALSRLYDIGIMPDWWKLEPTASALAWQNIVDVIEKRDPYCRGVVLLGLSSPIDALIASFECAASFRLIRGFAVGRTIFHDVARDWLSGAIDDDNAVKTMASRLSTLSAAWRAARARVEAVA